MPVVAMKNVAGRGRAVENAPALSNNVVMADRGVWSRLSRADFFRFL